MIHRRKRIRLACVLVALAVILMGRATGAGASQALQCGGWTIVTSPNPFQALNFLNATTTVSASDVWAVGWGADSENSNWLTLIEHWNGTMWQVVPSPSPFGNILMAVTAVSATDVWAVGDDTQYSQTLTEHWDGQHWTVIPSPNSGAFRNGLLSATALASDDVWAVGLSRNGSNSPNQTLIEHWNGKQWSVITSPHLAHYDNYLNGVMALSPTDVWAVGQYAYHQRVNTTKTLIEHWDGTKWRIVPSPNRGKAGSTLNEVAAVSSQDVWTVGTGGVDSTLTEHWNGTKWSIIKSPGGSQMNNILFGVTALTANDVWAVGSDLAQYPKEFVTLTEHWDGKQWKVIPSPNAALYNYLTGVTAASTHSVWAVGYSQNQDGPLYPSSTLIELYC